MLCDSTYVRPREQSTRRGKEERGYGGQGRGRVSAGTVKASGPRWLDSSVTALNTIGLDPYKWLQW